MTGAPPVVALFGATALGKSDVALELAARLGADIVVADSMQIYAGLPVLTNQPGDAARARVRYHLVGWAPAQDEFTVAEYADRAHAAVDAVLEEGRSVVAEGGSGLYLRALLGGLAFGGPPDPVAQGRARGALGARAAGARGRTAPARSGGGGAGRRRQRAPRDPRPRVARRAGREADG